MRLILGNVFISDAACIVLLNSFGTTLEPHLISSEASRMFFKTKQ